MGAGQVREDSAHLLRENDGDAARARGALQSLQPIGGRAEPYQNPKDL
jgi:hypothetical protein